MLPRPTYTRFESDSQKQYKGKPFNLLMPRYELEGENGKLLVILDRPSFEDQKRKMLFSQDNETTAKVFENICNYVLERAESIPKTMLVCNFWDCRVPEAYGAEALHKKFFLSRLKELVKTFKPTSVLLLGPTVTEAVLTDYFEAEYQVGRIHSPFENVISCIGTFFPVNYDGFTAPTIASISLHYVTEGSGKSLKEVRNASNLIGHIVRHMDLAFLGRNRYEIPDISFNTILIDTLPKFKKFFDKLVTKEVVALDTETRNLNRLDNSLASIQFSWNKTSGYFLPMFHPETPFSSKELRYIKRQLASYFDGTYWPDPTDIPVKYHIYHNAKFDVIQLKKQLELEFYHHDLYDTAAAEFQLDENRIFRGNLGISAYSLEQIAREYGYFGYHTAEGMAKSERENIFSVSISRLAEYGVKDVVLLNYLHDFQLREFQRRGPKYNKSLKTLTKQLSAMIHSFVNMELNGLLVDRAYLIQTMSPDSDFHKLLNSVNSKLASSPSIAKCNSILRKKKGVPENSLFGESTSNFFDIDKTESQQLLFFDVLGLEALENRADGGGKVNKPFQKHYSHVPEVKLFTERQNLQKLNNTYLIGFQKKISTSPDMNIDSHMRPIFEYLKVLTGRAAARKPSLQQIPEHGPQAKVVKRQFITYPGCLYLKLDYSAHEVRNWGIIARDSAIAQAFMEGMHTRWKFRLLTKIVKEKLKIWGQKYFEIDIHRISYRFFFNQPCLTKEQRNSIKAIIFGSVYGKGPTSLAVDLNKNKQVESLKKELTAIKKEMEDA